MRDHSTHIELSRKDAVLGLFAALDGGLWIENRSMPHENVALNCAYGRMLAEDVAAICDLPTVRTCCLDSVAVHWAAFEGLAVGDVPDTSAWVRGVDWQFANTGVAMPEGFDAAVVIEHVRVSADEQRIELTAAPSARFAGTREPGSKMRAGQIVAKAGTKITPDVAAAIASAGHSVVSVLRQPRVSFIPTGNELIYPNAPHSADAPESFAGTGHVFEANSFVVQGKVEAWGGHYIPFDIVPDEKQKIHTAVEMASDVSDIVVLNAGSSKGSDDWSVEVLEEMGQIICHQTNHGPGHHSSLTVLMNSHGHIVPIIGISGPAAGASFTLDFYLRPVMQKFLGLDPEPCRVKAKLAEGFGENKYARDKMPAHHAGEQRPPEAMAPGAKFYSVKYMQLEFDGEGQLSVRPLKGRPGSPETQTANALYMLENGPDSTYPAPGDFIEVELR